MAELWKSTSARSDLRAARRPLAHVTRASQVDMTVATGKTVAPDSDKEDSTRRDVGPGSSRPAPTFKRFGWSRFR